MLGILLADLFFFSFFNHSLGKLPVFLEATRTPQLGLLF